MSLLIESIKLQEGEFRNLFYHELRMNRALNILYGLQYHFNLEEFLQKIDKPLKGLYKCRIVYDNESKEVEILPYQPKVINTLKIIEADEISYEFKYLDRKMINKLFDLRKDCDDILMVKQGLVTDTSYANIVFRKGKRWYTPSSALLKGTMRSNLLERNIVQEVEIRMEDLQNFESFKLINAMFAFESPEIDMSNIVF